VCYYNVLSFILENQVDIVLSPSCGLVLHATTSITMGGNTSIRVRTECRSHVIVFTVRDEVCVMSFI
jgi:hypothetical protein